MCGDSHGRIAGRPDMAAVDVLLARSYPVLVKPPVLVTALQLGQPVTARDFGLRTRFMMEEAARRWAVAAGVWTPPAPGKGWSKPDVGHIHHVACDTTKTPRGIGSMLMARPVFGASGSGIDMVERLATRTAMPFDPALGEAKATLWRCPARCPFGSSDYRAALALVLSGISKRKRPARRLA